MAIANIGPSWTLGDRLAKARREAGLQAREMADIFGVSRNTISAWEHDAVEIKASTVRRWAEVTNVSVSWLMPDEFERNGDGRGPHRAPAAGAAVLPVPTGDADEATNTGARGRSLAKNAPHHPRYVNSSERYDSATNEPTDLWRTPSCTSDHAEKGKAA